jgi:poly-gamma-glutamate synthesis protein (capsule biosynthesis protein)
MANLETPLTTAWDPADKRIQFHSDPVLAVTLREAGLDVVNVANNHAMDQNQTGLNQTISVLRAAGLQAVGAGFDRSSAQQAAYRPTPSGLVAILGFTDILPVGAEAHRWRDGVTPVEADVIWHDIRQARERAGWVMVNVHWGVEYSTEPSDRQRQVAHWLIDAGADVVFGGHPHVVQGVEIYRNRPIVYSLGNFVFDQPWAITQETAVAVFGFNRGNDWQLVLQPAAIHNSQPDLIHDGFEWREFIARETRLSQKLGSRPGLTAEGELLWSSSPAEP